MSEIYNEEGKIVSRENISNDNAIIYEENLDETIIQMYIRVYHDDINTLN